MSRLTQKIAATCLALGVFATAAQADDHDHTVLIYDDGFFPEDLYVGWGDKIRYINRTGGNRTMKVPYYEDDDEVYELEFHLQNGEYRDLEVWLNGTNIVEIPNDGDHDGRIINGVAPRG